MVTLPNADSKRAKDTVEEMPGMLSPSEDKDDKLMNSVVQGDKDAVDDAKLMEESINNNMGSFIPDLLMQQMVQNYKTVKQLYGDTIMRLLSSYDSNYIEKNIKIPEFQRELQKSISNKINELKRKKLIDQDGTINKRGEKIASLILCIEELDNLKSKGNFGERINKRKNPYGIKDEVKPYRKGDRYSDIALKKSVTLAIKRGHSKLQKEDLISFERKSKGSINIIYGLDASGSMKGNKIKAAKKAGVALAYKAISEKNKVGLLVFETEIKDSLEPTNNFPQLLEKISAVRATKQTDFISMIRKSIQLFPPENNSTKHLVLLTDAMPTVGDNPEKDTLEAVSEAAATGITISLVGIGIEKKNESLAKKIVEIGNGKFHRVKNLDNLDSVVLEDYYEYL